MEPDLIILLGNDDNAEAVVMYSQVLATQSDYVHAILSNQSNYNYSNNPLKGKMICFPDVNRTTWDKAMDYLRPGKILDMILWTTSTTTEQQEEEGDDEDDAFLKDMPCILPFYQQ